MDHGGAAGGADGAHRVPAIVVGGGATVWRDVTFARQLVIDTLGIEPIVFAVNDAAAEYPGVLAHLVSLHPEKVPTWRNERSNRRLNRDFTTWAHDTTLRSYRHGIDRFLPERGGSSGLFALDVAIHLGFSHNILCGVPMDASNHFRRNAPFREVSSFRSAWSRAIPALRPVTRSMSGWTREQFGEPTAEWLLGVTGDPAP